MTAMNSELIQRLRLLPVEEVAARLGLEVRQHRALCPFHNDRHPSLSFSISRNTWRCWACGEHGGTIDLAMRCLGLGFAEACRWLGGAGLAAPAEQPPAPAPPAFDAERYERFLACPWLSAAARRFLYDERCLDPRVVGWLGLASWRDRGGAEWLQIPYRDLQGRLTGIQNRNLAPGAEPRFRFARGSQCGIYNLPAAALLRPGEPLWLAEGPSDCWALLSDGRKAVAIPSATLLKPESARLLRRLADSLGTPFHIYPDQDAAGESLFRQLRAQLPSVTRHALPCGCKDYADLHTLRKGGPR